MPTLEFKLKHQTTESYNFVWKPVSKWISGDGSVAFTFDDETGKKITGGIITYAQSENTSTEKRYGEIILYNNFKKFAVFKVAQRGKPFLTFNGTAETYTLNIDGKEHIYIVDDSSVNDSDPIICNIEMHNIVAEDNTHNRGIYHDDIYFDKGIFNCEENKWIRPLGYNSIIDTYIDEANELFEQSNLPENSGEPTISNITHESETNIDYNDKNDTNDSFYTLHIEEEGFIYKLGFNVQQNFTGISRSVTINFYNRYPKIDKEYDEITNKDFIGENTPTYENKIIGTLTIKQEPYIEFLIDSVETKSSNIRAVELNDYEYYIESVKTEGAPDPNNTELTKIVDNSYLGEINDDFKPIVKVFNDKKSDTTLLTIENNEGKFLVRHLGIPVTDNVTITIIDVTNNNETIINDVNDTDNVYPTDQCLYNITVVYSFSEKEKIEEYFTIDNTDNTGDNIDNTHFIERIPNSIYHRTYKQLDNIINYLVAGCSNQYISVKTDADWVTIKSVDTRNRKIYYQVSENTSEDEREAIINVSFYGGNTTIFTIKQFGQPSLIFEQSGSNVLDYWVSKTGTSKIEGDEFLEYSLPIKEMKNIIPELLYSINIDITATNGIYPLYPNQQTVIEDIIGYETVTPNYKHDSASNSINIAYNTYTKFIALSSRKSSTNEHIISGENTMVETPIINALTPVNNTDANSYNICQHMCAVELKYYESTTATASEVITASGTITATGIITAEGTITVSGTITATGIITASGTITEAETITAAGTITVSGNVAASGIITASGTITTYNARVSDSLVLTTNDNLTKNVIDETVKLIYNDRNIANINLKQYDFDFIFIDPIELNVNSSTHTYHLHYSSDNSNYLRFRLLNEESANTPTIGYFAANDNNYNEISFYTNTPTYIYAVKDFAKSTATSNCQHNAALKEGSEFPYIIVDIPENADTSVRGWNIAVDCAPDALFGKVITYVISIEQCGKLTMEILRNELSNCISFNKYIKEIEFGIYNVDGNRITFSGTPSYKVKVDGKDELLSCKMEHGVDPDVVNKPNIDYPCIFENKYSQLNYNKEFNTYSFRCVSRITIPENRIKFPINHKFTYSCPLLGKTNK